VYDRKRTSLRVRENTSMLFASTAKLGSPRCNTGYRPRVITNLVPVPAY
jgi:hypothetical protein